MKHTKIVVLSLSAILAFGGIAGAASYFLKKGNETAKVEETPFEDVTVQDDIGSGIKFLGAEEGDATAIKVSTNVGVQTIAADDGTYSLRYVAKLNEYHGLTGASFTRTVTSPSGEVVKEAKTISIDTVYTSLTDSDTVLWAPVGSTATDTDTTDYSYYAVYTLKNIPADHLFDTVAVKFSAVADQEIGAATQSANVMGVVGEVSKGVTFAQTSDEQTAGTWHTEKEDSSITEAIIPENHISVATDTYIATDLGKVVAIGNTTSSTGGFESCSSLVSVAMPSSIETFNKWCFYNCKSLVDLVLPESLTTIMGSAFSNLEALTTLTYKAKALSSVSDTIDKAGAIVNVDAGITSLPSDRLFEDSYAPKQINFGGTEAEWATLMDGKTNGLGIDNVICSDTVVNNVTFHIGEGTIKIDGKETTGDYTAEVIKGHVLATIGSPSLTGKMFTGWYTAETDGEKYDFTATVTGDLNLYARYEDLPAGKSIDDPFVVTAAPFNANITTIPDMEIYYVKFTAPATDTYYVKMANIVLDADTSSATSTSSGHIFVYDSTKTAVTPTDFALSSTDKIQAVKYADNGAITANLAKDDVYYFAFVDYYSTYNTEDHGYGTADVSITTKENDTPDTAIAYTFGETAQVSYVEDDPDKFYSFTAATTGTLALNIVDTGSFYFDVSVYEEGGFASPLIDGVHGTSDTTKLFSVTAGKKYYIACSSNGTSTEAKYFSFSVSNPPAGSSAVNPSTNLVIGAAAMSVDNVGGYSTYYKVTVATDGTYRFLLSGGSQYTQKFVEVFDSTGATSVGKMVSPGKVESSGWGDDETYYDDAYEYDLALTAGDYIVNVGFPDTSTPESIKIQMLLGNPGFAATCPIALGDALTGASYVFDGTDGNKAALTTDMCYYSFTALESKFYSFALTTELTGVSVTIVSSDGKTTLGTMASGEVHFKATAGTTYVFGIGGATGNATLALTIKDSIQDGTTKDTAFTFTGDATTGLMSITPGSSYQSAVWYKVTVAEAGTYRFWSTNDGSADTKLNEVYAEDSTTSLGFNDDGGGSHTDICAFHYDYYLEIALSAAGTYYFPIKIPSGTYNLSAGVLKIS